MFPKRREGWRVHSKQTIYTSEPFNNNPRKKEFTTHEEREFEKNPKTNPNILSMSERQFPLMYKIYCHFSTHLEKPQKQQRKRTIKTMYAFCYTERHSVWYVVYYCKHILTDICYRVERKEKRSTLSSNGNPLVYILTLQCGAKRLVPLVLEKPLLQDQDSLKMGNNKSIHRGSVKWNPSTTSLHQVKNNADTGR